MTYFRARIRNFAVILIAFCVGLGTGLLLSLLHTHMCDTSPADAERFSEEVRDSVLQAGLEVISGGGSGTGIIWKKEEDGSVLILTCAHIIRENEKTVVRRAGETTTEEAELVGCNKRYDVAVLRITSPKGDYGDGVGIRQARVEYGTEVIACVNPGGAGLMLTCGVVGYPYENKKQGDLSSDYHRTDILLAPGASGGGVYDREGKLVGMICFREDETASDDEDTRGRGYAIPADTLIGVASFILENKSAIEPISISFFPVKTHLENAKQVQELAVIRSNYNDCFSSLLTGDRVIFAAVNGKSIPVDHAHYLSDALYLLGKGDELSITVERFGYEICFSFSF